MEFSKIDAVLKRPVSDRQGDLLKNIHLLVDCLVQSEGCLSAPTDTHDQSVAGNALVAATLAERHIEELSQRIVELEKLAMTDELTGLMNRRGFQTELNRTLSSANRYQERGVLIYIDLDQFKPVNDRLGHAAGDEVLRHVGRILMENIRDTDYISRLGGDEFAVLMPRTNWKDGLSRAGVIEQRLNAAHAAWQDQSIPIQASLGLQNYTAGDCLTDLLKRADEAMYKTKRYRTSLSERPTKHRRKNNPTGRPLQQVLYAAT